MIPDLTPGLHNRRNNQEVRKEHLAGVPYEVKWALASAVPARSLYMYMYVYMYVYLSCVAGYPALIPNPL